MGLKGVPNERIFDTECHWRDSNPHSFPKHIARITRFPTQPCWRNFPSIGLLIPFGASGTCDCDQFPFYCALSFWATMALSPTARAWTSIRLFLPCLNQLGDCWINLQRRGQQAAADTNFAHFIFCFHPPYPQCLIVLWVYSGIFYFSCRYGFSWASCLVGIALYENPNIQLHFLKTSVEDFLTMAIRSTSWKTIIP